MKTNIGLVDHVKRALSEGWGYVWGTFGQILNTYLFSCLQEQYPSGVGNYYNFIHDNWLNKRTADCVGLIKSYMWWNDLDNGPAYESSTDVDADTMYNLATEKGEIGTIPDIIGLCLWKKGHIGVYIGNGQVIEAHGTMYGVIQTPLWGNGATAWTHWLKCPYISYDDTEVNPNLYKGSFGDSVKELQTKLNIIGYNLDVDGQFGPGTENAVINFQDNNNLTADGVVGSVTMEAINNMVDKLETPQKSFEDIVREISDGSADEWIEKVNSMQSAAEADGDIGAFEFCKYFKLLVVKAYYHK